MSNQHQPATPDLTPPSEESTPIESLPSTEQREPSQYAIALLIADRLDEGEEARRKHIISLVRTLGRTQALALLSEAEHACEQSATMDGKPTPTAGEVFCDLAYTKGRLKANQLWGKGASTRQSAYLPSDRVIARKIGERLDETHVHQSILLKQVVGVLGPVQAWALMLDALEIKAHGGMMVLNETRRRTVGGIFLYLVSTRGRPRPGKVLKRYQLKNSQHPSLPTEESA